MNSGELHQLIRKVFGNWVNFGFSYQVWLETWLSTEPGDSPRGLHCENRLNVKMDSGELHQLMRKDSVIE